MKRPLCYLTIFFVLGIFLGQYIIKPYFIGFVFFVFLISYVMFLKTKWIGSYIAIIFFIIGYFLSYNKFNYKDNYIQDLINKNQKVNIQCIVLEVSKTKTNKTKLTVKTTHINDQKLNYKIIVYLSKLEQVNISEQVILNGNILNPEVQRNPGGYDERLVYLSSNINYKMFANITKRISIVHDVNYYLNYFKTKIINIYDSVLPTNEANIVKSLVLGYNEDLDQNIKDLYIKNGIYHILAISGTHITIVMFIIYFILNKVLNPKPAFVISLTVLIVYCIFTGASPSTVRAVLMATILIVGKLIYRDYDLLTALATCSIIVLLFNPATLFNVGFLLSYGAILGIGLFYETLYYGFTFLSIKVRFLKYEAVKKTLASMLAVNLVTIPVSCYFFYHINIYFIIPNIIVLLSATVLIIVSLAVAFFGVFNMTIATFLAGTLYFILKFYEHVCKFFVSIPYNNILIGRLPTMYHILYILILFFCVKIVSLIHKNYANYKTYLGITVLCLVFYSVVDIFFLKDYTLTMLDVSQGDSFVITNKTNTIVIDTGENGTVLNNFLEYNGISNIDMIFISHTDSDHAGGFSDIIKTKNIKRVLLPNNYYEDFIKDLNIKVDFLKSNDIIRFGDLTFEIFNPTKLNINEDINSSSLVFKMIYKNSSFLFTGDIEQIAENNILRENFNLKSDVLKVAHHGSKTSTTVEFLNTVSPSLAIISVGQNNKYNHPNKEVLDRLSNVNVLRTDLNGAVTFYFKDKYIKYIKQVNNGAIKE